MTNCITRRLSGIRDVLFVGGLALSFYAILHFLYDIKVTDLDNYKVSPSTIITINHKRDLDFPLITPILHVCKTFFHPRIRPCLVARDDMFKSGYFTSHSSSALPFGRLLHHWNPATILRPMPVYPISHLLRKPLRALLYDIIDIQGDTQLRNVIKADCLQRFCRILDLKPDFDMGSLTVKNLLGYDYRTLHELPIGVGILLNDLARQVRIYSMEKIDKQLQALVRVLDEGGTCLLAPEGNLWPDGRFWPIKSGLHRLISMTKAEVRILPINITCDFMTRGRMPIYVTVGEELQGVRKMPRMTLETLLQRKLVSLGPVTMGQMGSDYILKTLRSGKVRFKKQELTSHLLSSVVETREAGMCLADSLANKPLLDMRLNRFLQYCINRRILIEESPYTFTIQQEKVEAKRGSNHAQNPIQYSYNEFRSLREAYARL